MSAPARRHIARRYARLKPQQIFLAVHRVEFTVYYRRLEPQEFHLLQAIGQGRPIGEALEAGNRLWSRIRFRSGLRTGLNWDGFAGLVTHDAEDTKAV